MPDLQGPSARAGAPGVLITGCSSGFGKLIALTMGRAGFRTYATMRDLSGRNAGAARELREWAAAQGAALEVMEMDVASEASVNAAVTAILDAGHGLDIVVNNAGATAWGPCEAFDFDQVYALYNVNLFGPWRVDKAVLPHMRARGSGLLIHVTSVVGRVCLDGGLYPASKWAAEGLGESMARELAPLGIDLVLLEPGSYPTAWMGKGQRPADPAVAAAYEGARSPAGDRASPAPDYRPPDPQEVADEVVRLAGLPAGQRPLRSVVGRIYTEGVAEYNAAYERLRHGLRDALTRTDQATPWI